MTITNSITKNNALAEVSLKRTNDIRRISGMFRVNVSTLLDHELIVVPRDSFESL